ncbi:MAG: succinate dehydrogenase assembly factor 2 [Pseudomonadota bacterium]
MPSDLEEAPEIRFKRLQMRSWRRGTKEMDLILGPFSDSEVKTLSANELDAYEAMLTENDQDLYRWVSGQDELPELHASILEKIREFHHIA